MKNTALTFAGLIFLAISGLHFFRYHKSIAVTFDGQTIPVEWSLYGGIVTVALALWMFYAATRR